MNSQRFKRTGTHRSGFQLLLFLEALPILVGVVLYAIWRLTGSDRVITAGLYTLTGGAALVLLSLVIAVVLAKVAWRSAGRPLAVLCGLAALNVVVAFGLGSSVLNAKTAYRVTVHNASSQALHEVRVVGGGLDESLGTIAPGETVKRSLWFEGESSLELRLFQGTRYETATIEGYVCTNLGGQADVTVGPAGKIGVAPPR